MTETNERIVQAMKDLSGVNDYAVFRQAGMSIPRSLGMTLIAKYGPLVVETAAVFEAYQNSYISAAFYLACAESLRFPTTMGVRELKKSLEGKASDLDLEGDEDSEGGTK